MVAQTDFLLQYPPSLLTRSVKKAERQQSGERVMCLSTNSRF